MNKPFTTLITALCFAATFAAGVSGGVLLGQSHSARTLCPCDRASTGWQAMRSCIPITQALREAHELASSADWQGIPHGHWHTWLAIRDAMARGCLWWPEF